MYELGVSSGRQFHTLDDSGCFEVGSFERWRLLSGRRTVDTRQEYFILRYRILSEDPCFQSLKGYRDLQDCVSVSRQQSNGKRSKRHFRSKPSVIFATYNRWKHSLSGSNLSSGHRVTLRQLLGEAPIPPGFFFRSWNAGNAPNRMSWKIGSEPREKIKDHER